MEGDAAVRLLLGFDVRVYVKLDNFSFHFADSSKQTFEFLVREGLETSFVGFNLIDDLKHA